MLEIFIKILPLMLGTLFAPVILGLAIFLLASKTSPIKKILSYLSGDVFVVIIYAVVGWLIGSGILNMQGVSPHSKRIVDIVIGVIFIILGVIVVFRKSKSDEEQIAREEKKNLGLLKWFSIGFIANFSNFDAVALYITTNKEINQSTILIEEKIILIIVAALFFLLPVLLPLILYLIAPRISKKTLKPVYSFSLKYGKYVTMAIFFIFGIYLIIR